MRDTTPPSDDPVEDCPHDTTTTCEVDVGGSATGTHRNLDVTGTGSRSMLEAGTRYQIDTEGADTEPRHRWWNPDSEVSTMRPELA